MVDGEEEKLVGSKPSRLEEAFEQRSAALCVTSSFFCCLEKARSTDVQAVVQMAPVAVLASAVVTHTPVLWSGLRRLFLVVVTLQ